MLTVSDERDELGDILKRIMAKIVVMGVGGAGNNTVSHLMNENVDGITTIAVNTDAQDLYYCNAHKKILIGKRLTGGLGAGNDPDIGEAAALESEDELRTVLKNVDLLFITCGLGGGTGTGAAPIIAEMANDLGILTVSIFTLPFRSEGEVRIKNALKGLQKLMKYSDTFIPIENDKLLNVAPEMSIIDAFKLADDILIRAVKGIAELAMRPGLVNLDFADIRTILEKRGYAVITTGEGNGDKKSEEAVRRALENPLLDIDISSARGALINITGGRTMKLKDAENVINLISQKMAKSAEVIWGALIDPSVQNSIRVTLIISGIENPYKEVEQ
ncbi:MAG: cell division protein FtsZ [Candidatus Asgardarchaeia archaeon]